MASDSVPDGVVTRKKATKIVEMSPPYPPLTQKPKAVDLQQEIARFVGIANSPDILDDFPIPIQVADRLAGLLNRLSNTHSDPAREFEKYWGPKWANEKATRQSFLNALKEVDHQFALGLWNLAILNRRKLCSWNLDEESLPEAVKKVCNAMILSIPPLIAEFEIKTGLFLGRGTFVDNPAIVDERGHLIREGRLCPQ